MIPGTFPTEDELFIPLTLICLCAQRQKLDMNKIILDRSCTEFGNNSK